MFLFITHVFTNDASTRRKFSRQRYVIIGEIYSHMNILLAISPMFPPTNQLDYKLKLIRDPLRISRCSSNNLVIFEDRVVNLEHSVGFYVINLRDRCGML